MGCVPCSRYFSKTKKIGGSFVKKMFLNFLLSKKNRCKCLQHLKSELRVSKNLTGDLKNLHREVEQIFFMLIFSSSSNFIVENSTYGTMVSKFYSLCAVATKFPSIQIQFKYRSNRRGGMDCSAYISIEKIRR